jgi:predicted nucleic acid-binding Zn ribbon protein
MTTMTREAKTAPATRRCLVCGREPPEGSVLCREHREEWQPKELLSGEDSLARQLARLAAR